MTNVFMSYATEDRPRAGRIAEILSGRGWDVWWDRELVAGASFDQVIEDRLDAADAVIVLWSPTSVRSEWVRAEAAAAVERKVLVPISIEPSQIPLRFRNVQTIDLSGWDGVTVDARLDRIDRALRSLAGDRSGPSSAAVDDAPLHISVSIEVTVVNRPVRFDRVDRVKRAVGQAPARGDDKWWILGEAMKIDAGGQTITIPAGFTTDGSSLPSWAEKVSGWESWEDPQRWPCVAHAWLYARPGVTKRDADLVFGSLLKSEGASFSKRAVMLLAVRVFGGGAYRASQSSGPKVFG